MRRYGGAAVGGCGHRESTAGRAALRLATFLFWERRHFGQGLGDTRGGRRKKLKTHDRRSSQQTR